jgi:dTDP-4-dehydrorhamnose 3,5-epimerase
MSKVIAHGAHGGNGPIPGVRWGRITRHDDERGSFREVWRASDFDDVDPADAGETHEAGFRFVQSNVSVSAPGVLRGLHLHRRQLDHWVVADGLAFIALVDVRPMLRGADRPMAEWRVAMADTTISIPTGVAHGFLALEAIDLIYFVTNLYDGTDELGFAWDDPLAGIPWPNIGGRRPILSPRDQANPPLRELVARTLEANDRGATPPGAP